MSNSSVENALAALEQLKGQLARFTQLEKQCPELEKECRTLETTLGVLEESLDDYASIRKDWEWFFENSIDMKFVVSRDGYFTRVNPMVTQVLGFTEEELTSRPFLEFIHPEDLPRTIQELKNLEKGIITDQFENRYRDKRGNWHWISWCSPPYSAESKQLYAMGRDVTDRKKSQEELLYQAMHDPLTGLRNRLSLEQELVLAMKRCDQMPHISLAIIAIDLDDFKVINDTHGHAAGDYVLQKIAERFNQIKRRDDLIFRIGGDEFVWITEGIDHLNRLSFIERIEKSLSHDIPYDEHILNVGASIGIAAYPSTAHSPSELLAQADRAMYHSKLQGKDGQLEL